MTVASDASGLRSDRGSVLVLGIGFIGVVLLAISVVTDAAMAFVQRQALQARVDSAALAAVQAIDLDTYYRVGATEATTLVPAAARARAMDHLEQAQNLDPIEGLQVSTIDATASDVQVSASAPIRTAFWPIDATITVSSRASLDYVG